jgi:predicted DNA-binding transcriptional regulator AlpA
VEPLLTIEDLAERWQTTRGVIYGMRHRGRTPPAVFIGKELRWRLADVEEWERNELEGARAGE